MGFFFTGTILFFMGLFGAIVFFISRKKNIGWLCYISFFLIIAGLSWMIITGQYALIRQSTKEQDYQNAQRERNSIEYRILESSYIHRNFEKAELYNDIANFNKKIQTEKENVNSFWFNWYANDLIAQMDYIKIDGTYESEE